MTLKCLSCQVQFESPGDHRSHFQAEWHCYNLKRKVASLPPITHDDFDKRKQIAQIESEKKNRPKKNKKQKNTKGKIRPMAITLSQCDNDTDVFL